MTALHENLWKNDKRYKYEWDARNYNKAAICLHNVEGSEEPNTFILLALQALSQIPDMELDASLYIYLISYPACERLDITALKFAEEQLAKCAALLKQKGIINEKGMTYV